MKQYKVKDTHDTNFIYSRSELIDKLQNYSDEYNFKIGLFGSYARDTANNYSDIDLLMFEDGLVLKNNNHRDGYEFKKRLEEELKKDVSINFWDNLKAEVEASSLTDLVIINPNDEGGVQKVNPIISTNPLE